MCGWTCLDFEKFQKHLQDNHEVRSAALCDICNKIFLNNHELNLHCQVDHYNPAFIPPNLDPKCYPQQTCTDSSDVLSPLSLVDAQDDQRAETHFNQGADEQHVEDVAGDAQQTLYSQLDTLSPLPQVDGQHDDLGAVHQAGQPDHETAQLESSHSVLKNNYTLNQSKQIQSLLKNSKVANFEVVLNDGGKNAILKCSLGFYEAVVKPNMMKLSAAL